MIRSVCLQTRTLDAHVPLSLSELSVDRIPRNSEPLQRQLEGWRQTQIADERAKLILYEAFVEGELEAPRSLPNALTRVSKTLDPDLVGYL